MKTTTKSPIGNTAATSTYLIERVKKNQVNVFESQGSQWVTVKRDISLDRVGYFGFDESSPSVLAVFAGM